MRSNDKLRQSFTNVRTHWGAAAAFGLVVCGAFSSQAAEPDNSGLDVVKVRTNFYMIAGAGGNIGVQIGSDGVMLLNSGNGAATTEVMAALKKLTDLPIRYIINVDAGADFVGGNEKLAKAGYTIFTNALGGGAGLPNGGGASILAHDSVLRKISSGIVATFAGTTSVGFTGDNGSATSAELWYPLGIAADSLAPRRVGELMFPYAQRYVERVVLVGDDAIRAAQERLFHALTIVAEPGGAAAFAALLAGAYVPASGERVCVIVSGGNSAAVDFTR